MTDVYVLLAGEFDEQGVEGVYTTLDAAKAAAENLTRTPSNNPFDKPPGFWEADGAGWSNGLFHDAARCIMRYPLLDD